MNAIADKLDKARALIEKGWTKGQFHTDDGRYCADGALCRVAGPNEYSSLVRVFERAIGVEAHNEIWTWNDVPERTQADVIDAFMRAAELARASGASQ